MHRAVLLRLTLFVVLLAGLLPSAPAPAATAAPSKSVPSRSALAPLPSNPAPEPNVTPASIPARAKTGQLPSSAAGSVDLLLPASAWSGAGIWYYHEGTWSLKSNGLPTSGWRGVVADPFD